MNKCIIFSAPSGSGKTSIVQQLLLRPELKLEFSISATTRPSRGQEVHGKDYYFLSIEDFKQKIAQNELVEWEEVYEGTFYGTLRSELERIWAKNNHVIFDVDVKGGLNLKNKFEKNALAVFIKPPSMVILEQRLRNRGSESEDKIKQRLAKAEFELSFADKFDIQIVNNNLDESVKESRIAITRFIGIEKNK
jgi:guanylate kinase